MLGISGLDFKEKPNEPLRPQAASNYEGLIKCVNILKGGVAHRERPSCTFWAEMLSRTRPHLAFSFLRVFLQSDSTSAGRTPP